MIRKKKESGLLVKANQFHWLLYALLVSSVTQVGNLYVPLLAFLMALDYVLISWNNDNNRKSVWVVSVGCAAMRWHVFTPVVLWTFVMNDQRKIRYIGSILDAFAEKVADLWESIAVPIINPMTGCNSSWVPTSWKQLYDERVDDIKTLLTVGLSTRVDYLREVGVADYPVPLSQRPGMDAKTSVTRYEEIGDLTRMAFGGFVLLIVVAMTGPLGMLAAVMTFVMTQLESDDAGITRLERNRGVIFKDGTYRVTTTIMSVDSDRGIGVALGGIMHVPYHVCKARPLMYGKTKVLPYYINVNQDLVTYGGPPSVDKLLPGDEVYVNCETDHARTSYRVSVDYDSLGNMIAWQGVTKPGESGSPVLALRDVGEGMDKKLVLLGLAGRYVRDHGETVEFSNITPVKDDETNHVQITLHPGAGKTWREIPEIVNRHLGSGSKRILVTGPTRVVCKELYSSLSSITPVGLNIKDSKLRNEQAQVQIAAHRTALKLLTSSARCVKNLGVIIIDEAHVDDPATILLRRYAQSLIPSHVKLIELSATLDGVTNDESNFEIVDIDIRESEVDTVISEELDKGKRVLVFVPSVKGKTAKRIIDRFKNWDPVILSREKFDPGMKGIKDNERKLIISTDIAECGINVPGLDVVVDMGRKFTYVYDGGLIIGREVGITRASRTQRRGRVGRDHQGKYYEVKTDLTSRYVSAAQFDANLLGSGRSWTSSLSEWDISLTDHQFSVWLEAKDNQDLTPLEVWLRYDMQGQPRTRERRDRKIEQMRAGNNYYIGCRDDNCRCDGSYAMFDERAHDRLF
jgi:hypothetical protein